MRTWIDAFAACRFAKRVGGLGVAALLLVFVFAGKAEAGTLASVGTSMTYSLDTSGRNYEADVPIAVRGGYRFRVADVYAEVALFSTKTTGTEMIEVGSRNIEFLLWVRKPLALTRSLSLYGAAAVGGHQETVTTTYSTSKYRDQGLTEMVGALAGGLQYRLSKVIEASVEARLSAAESYSPSPRFGVGAFIGIAL